MKSINLPLLAILVVGVLIVAGAVHVLHLYQVDAQKQALLREAKRAQENGRDAEALTHLSRYLILEPAKSEVHAEYATLLVRRGYNRKAFFALEEAVRRNPKRIDLRRELVKVAISTNRHIDALPHLISDPKDEVAREESASEEQERGTIAPQEPQVRAEFARDPEMLCYLAQCRLRGLDSSAATEPERTPFNPIESARHFLEMAIAVEPARIETWLQLIEVLDKQSESRQAGRASEAAQAVNQLVEANPENAEALIVRAKYILNRRRNSGVRSVFADPEADEIAAFHQMREIAFADAEKALQLDPESVEARLLIAQCAQEAGDLELARERLDEAKELAPQSDVVYGRLAELALQSAEEPQAKAIKILEEGLEIATEKKTLLWNLGGLYIDTFRADKDRPKQARQTIERLKGTDQPRELVAFLEDRIAVAEERWLEASKRMEKQRELLAPWPHVLKQADYYLGVCYEQLARYDLALLAYLRARNADPYWTPARVGFASSLLSTGRISEALAEYDVASKATDAQPELQLEVARLMILSNLALDQSERDWSSVVALLDRLVKMLPNSPHITLLRAEMLAAQDKSEEAEALLAEASNKEPAQLDFRLALSALAQRRQDWDAAKDLLDRAKADLGDSVSWRLASGRMHVARQGDEAAPVLLDLEKNVESFSDKEKLQLYRGLAGLAYSVGERELLERLCEAAAALNASNLRIRLLQFDLVLRAQREWLDKIRRGVVDSDAAKEESGAKAPNDRDEDLVELLKKVHAIEGPGPLWHYGEAVRLMVLAQAIRAQDGDRQLSDAQRKASDDRVTDLLDKAIRHIDDAKRERATWSRLSLVAAQIDDLQENYSSALDNYLRAVAQGERDPLAIGRVTRLLYERQRYTEADELLRNLESEEAPFTGELVRIATDISLQLNNADRALEWAQKAAEQSGAFLDKVWLGQVLGMARRVDEARKTFDEAISQEPSAPEGYVAKVGMLVRAGLRDEAAAVIAIADREIDPNKDKNALAIASCFELLNDPQQAESRYRGALKDFPNVATVVRKMADHLLRQGKTDDAEVYLEQIASGNVKSEKTEAQNDLAWARRNLALVYAQEGGYDKHQEALSLLKLNEEEGKSIADLRTKALVLSMWPSRENRKMAIADLETVVKDSQGGIGSEGSEGGVSRAEDRYILANLYVAEARQLRESRQASHVEWEKARSLLTSLLSERRDDPRYHAAYVRYLSAYVRLLLENGEALETLPWLSQLEELGKDSLPTIELRVQALASAGRFSDAGALVAATAARKDLSEKNKPALLLSMARAAETAGEFCASKENNERAEEFFAQAEKLLRAAAGAEGVDPLIVENFLVERGRVGEALDSIAARPPVPADSLAGFTQRTMQYAAADVAAIERLASLVEKALTSTPDSIALHLALADAWNWLEKYDLAEERYKWIIAKDPNNPVAQNNLAMLLALRMKRNRLAEALAMIDKAIELSGPQAELLDSKAMILSASGNEKDALQIVQRAIEEAPTASKLFHRALVQSRLKDAKAAAASLALADDFGLNSQELHPLERPSLEGLRASLVRLNQ